MKRFAKALVNLVSSAGRASSVLMESGAAKLSDYAAKKDKSPRHEGEGEGEGEGRHGEAPRE
jgi:hypothetical protein